MRLLAAAADVGMPLTHPAALDALGRPEYLVLIEETVRQRRRDLKARADAEAKAARRRR